MLINNKNCEEDLHDSGFSPQFQPSPYPKMPDLSIAAEGIDKLLVGLNPHKAAGPDKFKPIVLQTLHKELAPILQLIFQRSLDIENYLTSGKRQMFPQFSKKGRSLTLQTTGLFH